MAMLHRQPDHEKGFIMKSHVELLTAGHEPLTPYLLNRKFTTS
jgi:hypothetical protein